MHKKVSGVGGLLLNYKSINMVCYGHKGLSGCPGEKENSIIFGRFIEKNKVWKDINSSAKSAFSVLLRQQRGCNCFVKESYRDSN